MIKRVITVGVLILVLMIAIKDRQALRTTGLTASCSVVQTAADGTQVEICRPGKLEGRPNLSGRGCTDAGSAGKAGKAEYWRCPAPVIASQVGR